MKEILGNNLKLFFDLMDKNCDLADITYAGNRYEVWEVSDELFIKMCDMTEEQFVELAGEDAWWRSSDGSNLWAEDVIELEVNGKEMICWDSPIYDSKKVRSMNLCLNICVNVLVHLSLKMSVHVL